MNEEKYLILDGKTDSKKKPQYSEQDCFNMAESDALYYIENGQRTVEIYKLVATYTVTDVARKKGDEINNLKLKK